MVKVDAVFACPRCWTPTGTGWPPAVPAPLRAARREVLASVYGTPGDRYTLTDTDLEVRRSLATYRIDLATANVRMMPSGKWLSFDSKPPEVARQRAWQQVPALDDDEILHHILVRAAILADDELLASRKLLQQIRG
jgi:hypothetical protein